MATYPLFSLTPSLGAGFEEIARAAIEIAALPYMPYVEFVFNDKRVRVQKHMTLQEVCDQYDPRLYAVLQPPTPVPPAAGASAEAGV